MKQTKPIKILISDDNATIRAILKKTLKLINKDFEIEEAADGEECIKKLSFEPDIVMLDLLMPKINGLRVIQHIKNKELLHKLEIIVISGIEDTENVALVNCFRWGASDFIYKPFKGKILVFKLLNLIQKVILRQNYLDLKDDYIHLCQKHAEPLPEFVDEIIFQIDTDNKLGANLSVQEASESKSDDNESDATIANAPDGEQDPEDAKEDEAKEVTKPKK